MFSLVKCLPIIAIVPDAAAKAGFDMPAANVYRSKSDVGSMPPMAAAGE